MQLNHKKITETTLKTGITGVLSGILTTATSMGGPPLILYLANANRDKVSMRATCIAYFAITNISAIIIFLMGNTDFTFAIEQSIYLLPFVSLVYGLVINYSLIFLKKCLIALYL